MKRLAQTTTAVILTAAMATPALAGHQGGDFYDYAEVLRVKPITETIRVDTPRRECWIEHVTYREQHVSKSYTPEIVGGILGAAVGNQFGSGSGRKVGAVAGALLGGSIAHDLKRRHGRGYVATRPVERCEVRHEYHEQEQVVAYQVKYRYNGHVYRTQMDEPPGERIRVRVSVVPAY